jgi:ribosome-binding protein aMBF1 (putative translation factor)
MAYNLSKKIKEVKNIIRAIETDLFNLDNKTNRKYEDLIMDIHYGLEEIYNTLMDKKG